VSISSLQSSCANTTMVLPAAEGYGNEDEVFTLRAASAIYTACQIFSAACRFVVLAGVRPAEALAGD
jgi:hypothetical protein